MNNPNLEQQKNEISEKIKELSAKIKLYDEELYKIKTITKKMKLRYNKLNEHFNELEDYFYQIEELKELSKKIKMKKKSIKIKYEKTYKELENLNNKFNFLNKIDNFNREDIFKCITYLVNKLENKNYILKYIPVLISVNQSFKYTLAYLVEEDKQDLATTELQKRFSRMIDKSSIEDDCVNDYYIQLAIFKKEDQDTIVFDELSSKVKPYSYMKDTSTIPHTKIYDVRFDYIYDFLNYVIKYKLENSLLTLDSMYKLADEFVENQTKKLIKK